MEDEESKANKIRSPQTTDSKAKNSDIKSSHKKADLGFERPYQRPTSPNTPHLTHIKPKNVVKKFAFATRVGFEPGNPDKQNSDAFILAPNI